MCTMTRDLAASAYKNMSTDYYLKERTYTYQYAPLYAERLTHMRDQLKQTVALKWPNAKLKSLVDLDKHDECVIIGTLYKEMKFKPSILKELAEDTENSLTMQPVVERDKYTDVDDQLILEDELQRIVLVDATDSAAQSAEARHIVRDAKWCTGVVVALLGVENEASKFEVHDFCFKETPMPAKHVATPASEAKTTDASPPPHKYIAFVSGLELGDAQASQSLYKLQLLVDFLRGDFVAPTQNDAHTDTRRLVEGAVRLVVAGNSLSASTQSKDMHNKAKYLTKNFVAGSVSAIRELDVFLTQLVDKIEVDVMPGAFDPSNLMLPQQPLHHAMFTRAKVNNARATSRDNLHTTTNPYRFRVDGVCFAGTSGQCIEDIRKSTSVDDPIELMKFTLDCGHLAPTCPDTLACYPYYGKDPFIIDELPHVYFAGNQNQFKHSVCHIGLQKDKEVHLISLPKFSTSGSCVFFNLTTFECQVVNF